LLTISLLAVLLGLALPSLRALQARTALATASNQLLLALNLARSAAITRGQQTTLCLNDAGGRCLPTAGTAALGYALQVEGPQPALLRRERLPPGLRLTATRSQIIYYPWPRAGTTVTFTLCDTGERVPARQVIVSQTGRPRVTSTGLVAPCR
jgi:type IV fimbrial biogenesis protein FimT